MERCPHCGTPGRSGAKFCTTCGFRFPENENDAVPVATLESVADTGDTDASAGESAWPSAPPVIAPLVGAGWEQPTAPGSDDAEADDQMADDTVGIWSEQSSEHWPAPPVDNDVATVAPPPEDEIPQLGAETHTPDASAVVDSQLAVARVQHLLDELRNTIGAMQRGNTGDLYGVISDLEVAVTPPGAMDPDDVAELREALLAARERPRDVDTIVDLTKRIDAMLALVIAYDRTIAAIERSLDVLRRG
ncbi:MAG: hypothetical protein H0T18_06745 [Chloroflexia bacterium]|nr:hypothetical protein [Chloroflexia bacterium]